MQARTERNPLKVAWIPYFPVEWLPNAPAEIRASPRMHPATWQRVLFDRFKQRPELRLEIIDVRSTFPRTNRFELDGARFHCIRTPPGFRAATLYWLDTLIIARELRRIRPDLVHAWGTEFGGAAIASRLKYPALVTVQGILTWCASNFPLNRNARISCFLEPGSLRRARVATCESSFAMAYLGEHYPQLELHQIEHAPNPVFCSVPRNPGMPFKIVSIGSFTHAKGADIVLKALDRLLPEFNFEFLWIGDRPVEFEQRMRREITSGLWSRVAFKSDLSGEDVAAELSEATLLVHASRVDNSPNSVKEAVVAGVPVVATKVGGIPDYVIPDKNGLLFRNGDVEDCRDKIRTALTHPLFSTGRVDPATLDKTRDYLSSATMAKKFHEAYLAALRTYSRSRVCV